MTKFPWRVLPDELFVLRGNGGQPFAEFVSALLRADAAVSGLKPDDVQTNTRVNLPDGGVDAEVKVPLGGPLRLITATCWQFKSTAFTAVTPSTLTEEANKPEAKRLIEAGYAYFVCVCDDNPSNKMADLDEALLGIVRHINPKAPAPRVLNVGHLADWVNRHPGIVLQFFRQHLGDALSYESWLKKERATLSTFVEVLPHAQAAETIRKHVTGDRPIRPVLSLRGPSGAGVSRLIAETLASAAPRVIYVPDPVAALGLTTSLVNQPTATAILVLDRCSTNVRIAVEELLKAETARLRAVVVQDPREPAADITISLQALNDSDVQKVIDANFGDVPSSHRRAFVHFADGVLKIAARLGTAYQADRPRFLIDSTAWAHDELRRLVRDDKDREVLQALSLFNRVGYQGDVSAQLDAACRMFGLVRKDVLQRCMRLSTNPGVLVVGPRYLSVRPRLFARPLFEAAWAEVAAGSVNDFIDALPLDLRSALLKQAAIHAPLTARIALVEWSTPWSRTLVPGDLGSSAVIERLLPLVEVLPSRIAPLLTDLVERASDDEASSLGERVEHWPARTHVILALRQLLERGATHGLAERALFRLARAEGDAESAARQSSSATDTWAASFRLLLSGTEVSFKARMAILRAKLERFGTDAVPLVVVALGFSLDSHASKTEGLPIASGDVRPQDWHPSTYGEIWESLDEAVALLGRCMVDPTHRGLALRTFVRHGRGLLQGGRLEALRSALQGVSFDERERVAVLGVADEFLTFDAKREDSNTHRYSEDYIEAVETWHKSLGRSDLSGRVIEAISASSYRRQFNDKGGWEKELVDLGEELFHEQRELEKLLPSLVGDDHHGGALFEIGRTLGTRDADGILLRRILGAAGVKNPLFLRGYVIGLATHGDILDEAVKHEIDSLEEANPELAVDLNAMNERIGSTAARAIGLVRSRKLPAESLARLPTVRVQEDLLADALEVVLDTMSDKVEDAAATALKILGPLAWDPKSVPPDDERTLSVIWRVLEVAVDGAHAEARAWGRVLRRLSEKDFESAIRMASRAAIKGDLSIQEEAACELSVYIGKDPTLVLSTLGPMLLDPSEAWRFLVGRRGALLNSFPREILKRWIADNGVEAARVVAAHMAAPHLDAEGLGIVPPLTAFVLEEFENDDRVFSSFCSGVHNAQLYCGDIAGEHEKEVELADKFRTHALRRIREWADQEAHWARKNAQRWREHEEEEFDE